MSTSSSNDTLLAFSEAANQTGTQSQTETATRAEIVHLLYQIKAAPLPTNLGKVTRDLVLGLQMMCGACAEMLETSEHGTKNGGTDKDDDNVSSDGTLDGM
ncbi:hypothetical protein NKR19_g4872 [Coniochaeta hoffmannii]|uniref:Uncharacterized protein n=1 Tax=Coniochaeta hoffmannii TaxID=91930 RepID=A0AA38VUK0_9PEZI|nr:hypothetical protein NKR19_g4872 [Coniochaeta hoffmannii]